MTLTLQNKPKGETVMP